MSLADAKTFIQTSISMFTSIGDVIEAPILYSSEVIIAIEVSIEQQH